LVVVTLETGFLAGWTFTLAAGLGVGDGLGAGWDALAPGAPPLVPGARAAIAAAGVSADTPGPVKLAGRKATPAAYAESSAVIERPSAAAGESLPSRCRPERFDRPCTPCLRLRLPDRGISARLTVNSAEEPEQTR
jgi:hypothetical protein